MARQQNKPGAAAKAADTNTETAKNVSLPFFSFARYTSLVGVHNTLLLFSAFFVPQHSTNHTYLASILPGRVPLTSADHPQHPFFNALTENPVSTLLCVCSAVAICQGWWGGWVKDMAIDYMVHGTDEEKRMQKLAHAKNKNSQVIQAWLAVFGSSFFFHFALVLFGAPIASYIPHTYLLALLLSLLTVFPSAYVLGAPKFGLRKQSVIVSLSWTRLFAEFSIQNPVERALVYPGVGAVFGCWLGAIPLALDWDRPWQAWPLVPALGAIIGSVTASLAALATSTTFHLAEEYVREQHQKSG